MNVLLAPPVIEEAGVTYRAVEYCWSEPRVFDPYTTIFASDADPDCVREAFNTRTFALNAEGFSRRNVQGNPNARRLCRWDGKVNHFVMLMLEQVVG